QKLVGVVGRISAPDEYPIEPEILGADGRIQVRPLWIFRIIRRMSRTRPDMTKPACHADAVGPHQVLLLIIAWVVVKSFRVPTAARRFIKIRVGKEPKSDDPRRLAVV